MSQLTSREFKSQTHLGVKGLDLIKDHSNSLTWLTQNLYFYSIAYTGILFNNSWKSLASNVNSALIGLSAHMTIDETTLVFSSQNNMQNIISPTYLQQRKPSYFYPCLTQTPYVLASLLCLWMKKEKLKWNQWRMVRMHGY